MTNEVNTAQPSQKIPIISLAPGDDNSGASQDYYEKKLQGALDEENINNIALTGIYGSGKSTILNTFKKKNSNKWNFAEISLSTFDTKDKAELDSEDLQLIERSILQQLFYSVNHDDIPLSRFKRIVKTSQGSKRCIFILISIVLISYVIAFNKDATLQNILPDYEYLPHIAVSLLLISSLTLLYKFLDYAISLKEIKLKLYDTEFNIKDEEDKSILNDHIDEIIYFFQETKKNVVIIEDLDRFDNTEIFIRLRELNSLINKACSHRIVFIYAIKDDMFTGTERSKFFEYIIPVIPVINPTNAYDFIKSKYQNIIKGIDDRFLRNTCLYFDDMRLLKNILNEYQDYSTHLKGLDLDKNQLFAMIVYKNNFPRDFAKLNSNQGEIYEVFNDRKLTIINNKISSIEKDIAELVKKKKDLSDEFLLSLSELNSAYSNILNNLLWKKNCNVTSFKIHGKEVRIGSYTHEELLMLEEANNQEIEYRTNDYYYRSSGIRFLDVEEKTGSNLSYSERIEAIKNKEPKQQETIVNKINNLNKELQTIKNQPMEKLLASNKELEISKNEQLSYFISHGYINENYTDYISLFFESSITKIDKEYQMIVNGRKTPKFDLKLNNPNELLKSYLSTNDMLTASALNGSMLSYLLKNDDFEKYRQNYIQKMCDKSIISVDFLQSLFINNYTNLFLLIPKLVKHDDTVFDEILDNIDDSQTVDNYSKIIKYVGSNIKSAKNLTKKLRSFLSRRADYIEFVMKCFDDNQDSFKQFSSSIEPEFKHLKASNVELFNWLGQQRYFAIDKQIIEDILAINTLSTTEEIKSLLNKSPFTTIDKSNISYLQEDFWQYTNDYIELFTKDLEESEKFNEDEYIFVNLLNNETVSNDSKTKLLLNISTKLTDISKVVDKLYFDSLYDELLKHDTAQANWKNLIEFFKSYEEAIPTKLVKFINDHAESLNEQKADYKHTISEYNSLHKNLESALIKCNDINDESYAMIVEVLTKAWENINFTPLSKNKVLALINSNKLIWSEENLELISVFNDDDVRKAFIEHNIKLILDRKLVEKLIPIDYMTILDSDRISKANKKVFIDSSNDIEFLNFANQHINLILEIYNDEHLPNKLYEHIQNNLTPENTQSLFLQQKNYLSYDEILKLLPRMGEPFNKLNENSKTKFEVNTNNADILNALHEKKVIVKLEKTSTLMQDKYYETRLQKK